MDFAGEASFLGAGLLVEVVPCRARISARRVWKEITEGMTAAGTPGVLEVLGGSGVGEEASSAGTGSCDCEGLKLSRGGTLVGLLRRGLRRWVVASWASALSSLRFSRMGRPSSFVDVAARILQSGSVWADWFLG